MNRKARRAAAKRQTISIPKSQEKLLAGMYKNGITEKHLEQNFDLGMEAGRREAIYSCYAAAALALHDELGFAGKRIMRVIRKLDFHVCNTLSSKEAIDNVNERFGLHITFADPFGHVEEA